MERGNTLGENAADPRDDRTTGTGSYSGASPQTETFSIELEEERGVPVVAAWGELDLYSAPRLRARLAEAIARAGGPRSGPRGGPSPGPPSVIVDLSGVTFADSMTLGVLIGERGTLRELGGDLHLVLGDGVAARLLEHAGLTGVFEIHPDRQSAVRGIDAASRRARR